MCTVIVGYKLFKHAPLIVAANRDELLDRPSRPPELWGDEDVVPEILAPVDESRLGTWIGVNVRGLFAALTNRVDIVSVRDKASRGGLVSQALQQTSAHDAMLRITAIDARLYNGFNLIVGDEACGLYVIRGDGVNGPERPYVQEVIPRAGSGLMIVTNLGVGPAHSPRAEAIERRYFSQSPQITDDWTGLLNIHDPVPKTEPEWMKRMASTCIHRPPEDNYGTRSSAFVTLNAHTNTWNYWHRERPHDAYACNGHWRPHYLPIT